MVLFAFSVEDQVEKYGAYVGIAAFFGLAILSLLYFAQAREVKRLREWAGRAPERAAELEQAVAEHARGGPPRAGTPVAAAAAGRARSRSPPSPTNGVVKLKPAEVAALAFARAAGVHEPHEPKPHPVPAAALAAAPAPAATDDGRRARARAQRRRERLAARSGHAAAGHARRAPQRARAAAAPAAPQGAARARRPVAPRRRRARATRARSCITAVVGVARAGRRRDLRLRPARRRRRPGAERRRPERRRRRPSRRRAHGTPKPTPTPRSARATRRCSSSTAPARRSWPRRYQTALTGEGWAEGKTGSRLARRGPVRADVGRDVRRRTRKRVANLVATDLGIEQVVELDDAIKTRAGRTRRRGRRQGLERGRGPWAGQEHLVAAPRRCRRRPGHVRGAGRGDVRRVLRRPAAQERPAGHQRQRSATVLLAQRRRRPGQRRGSRCSCASPTRRRSTSSTSTAIASGGSPMVWPMRAYSPYRVRWDGKDDDGAKVPDGRYRVRVSLRDEGRSAIIQKTMTVDTQAPRSMVCVGVPCIERPSRPSSATSSPRATAQVQIYIKGVSRFPTRFKVLRTDDGKPREVGAFQMRGKRHRYDWDGRESTASRSSPAPTSSRRRCATRRTTSAVTPAVIEPGAEIPGRPGLTVRGITAQPPLRPVTAGGRTEFFVDSRSAPYRWRVRRVGQHARVQARLGDRPEPRLPRPRGRLRALPARAALRALAHDRAVPGPGREALEHPRGRADDHLARAPTRSTTRRSTASRTRSRPAARCAGRGCSWATNGLPAGLGRRRAAARVPGSPQDPLRPHERPRPGPDPQPARERPQGRAARGLDAAGSRARPAGGCAST